jgi:large subunit ribosomal protein L4
MKIKLETINKKKSKSIEVDKDILNLKPNLDLIGQIFRIESLAKKKPAHTKDRSERSGGGRKPWRQKGTGRARHGSSRSPIWRKGGVTFGPLKKDNFKHKINKKMKRKGLLSLVADQAREERLIIVDKLPSYKKTKKMEDFILGLPIKEAGSILLIIDDKQLRLRRYLRNIPYLSVFGRSGLNVYNVLNHDYLIITEPIAKKLLTKKSKK